MRIGIDIDGVLTDEKRYVIDYGTKFFSENNIPYIVRDDRFYGKEIFNVTEEQLQAKGEKREHYEGLPVTSSSLVLPIVFVLIAGLKASAFIYTGVLFLLATAFVCKFKVPKFKLKQMVVVSAICLVLFLLVLLIRGVVG